MKPASDLKYDPQVAEAIFQREYHALLVQTDRFFAGLMLFQWVTGIVIAVIVSPRAWDGTESETHPHVWAALLLGGLIQALPVALIRLAPGTTLSRHAVAVAQMLTSALWIHLTGGRLETHFHVFGSLAFLAFYRDWRVLITASAVTAFDHIIRGYIWPESVYGIALGAEWRWTEHAVWVVFEDVFLLKLCLSAVSEMKRWAVDRAKLECHLKGVEREIMLRTRDLQVSEASIRAVLDTVDDAILTVDGDGAIVSTNESANRLFGYETDEFTAFKLPELLPRIRWKPGDPIRTDGAKSTESVGRRRDGTSFPVEFAVGEVELIGTHRIYTWVIRDITARKQNEREREELQRNLIDAAREAGMAEIATGVLHNVGNVLNSVNVSATIVREAVQSSRVGRVGDVAKMLSEQGENVGTFLTSDPKGSKIPSYLAKLSEQLDEERNTMLAELQHLGANIDHVKGIVAMQQSAARATGMEEPVSISAIIDDAIKFNRSAIDRHRVEISREEAEIPETIADRQKILQILVNLIKNAKEAVVAAGLPDGRITVETQRDEEGNTFSIKVSDTGTGIDPADIDRIFRQGFTTKAKGHGFGLHSCAIAAKTMGGGLSVDSEGPGRGATFTLTLPFRPVEVPV